VRGHRGRGGGAALACVVLVVVLVAAGCAGQDEQGTPRQRMRAWVDGTGFGSAVGTLMADGARVERLVAQGADAGSFHTACAVWLNDVAAAEGNLPTPDAQATQQLASAYALETQAAQDCFNAGAADSALQQRSARERTQAAALLSAALAGVGRIVGATVPTSTTTQPATGGILG
jgi:hypothetical protein